MNLNIKRAIDALGSGAALASAIGRSPQFVSQLLKGDRDVPADLCPVIEEATRSAGQAVVCEELRPDVRWDVLRQKVAPVAPVADAATAAFATERRQPVALPVSLAMSGHEVAAPPPGGSLAPAEQVG